MYAMLLLTLISKGGVLSSGSFFFFFFFFREQGNVYHGPNNIPDKVNGVKVDYSDNIVLHAFT
jgi:hypothetical protein